MSRASLYQLLYVDASNASAGTLGAIGLLPGSIYTTGVDTPKGDTFLIIKFDDMRRGMGASNRTNVTIWVYDTNKDYRRIEQMLRRIRQLFEGTEATQTDTGWITAIRWTGDGADLFDDVYRASVRNSAFQMIDSGR